MSAARAVRAVAAFAVLVALHYAVRPLLGWRVMMDLGFATGLIADALSPTALGAGALAMTLIGFAASWLKAVFFADNVVLHAFFFFAGKWTYDIIYTLAERRLGGVDLIAQLLLWSPLSAALTAVVGVLVLILFRTTLEPQSA